MYSNGWSWVNDPAVREEHFRIGRIIARQNLYRGPIPHRTRTHTHRGYVSEISGPEGTSVILR